MKKISRKKNRIVLLCMALLVVATYIAYGYYQFSNEKKQFDRVDKDIDQFIEVIKQKDLTLGLSKRNYCRNDDEKFGGGRLSCSIDVSFDQLDPAKIPSVQEELIKTFSDLSVVFARKSSSPSLNLGADSPSLYSYINTSTNVDCALYRSVVNQQTSEDFQISLRFSCGKHVRRAVY